MAQDDLNVLAAFLAVAEERSFAKAVKRLSVSRSALSHAVRGLEEEIGVRLLARTTRSVAPAGAGEELLRSLRPALTGIRAAIGRISGQRDKPAGRVRLVVSPPGRRGAWPRCSHDRPVSGGLPIKTLPIGLCP